MENEEYTEDDIGKRVTIVHEGVKYQDTIVSVTLPDNQEIIGPMLTCGHLYARFLMLPDMMLASERTKEFGDMA
jgi:hypothetical protein